MTTVQLTTAPAPAPAPPPPPLSSDGVTAEDLKRIDIAHLSQSELQALSSCSASAFDVRTTHDVVYPQLDRSVFNESAGSRRQTYSRLNNRSHSRLPGLHPSLKPHHHPHSSSDHVTHSIVHFLKHFLNGNHNPPSPPPTPPSPPPQPPQDGSRSAAVPHVDLGFLGLQEKLKIKRKRVRKGKNLKQKKLLENAIGVELQQVNCKGEVVDLAELESKGDNLYNEELKRRTVGLETEDGVLGFLWSLEGQWCSRRKKRKYVDSGMFGDALPVGWKLLLGLRRRDFRVSVYCRRYISPSGQQFLSCKEAASFLRSYFGSNASDQPKDQKTSAIQHEYCLSSEKGACYADKTDDVAHDVLGLSALVKSSPSTNDDCLIGIENLPEVKVQDIFECLKCHLTFDEKDVYLQHLFSFHQKTAKRCRFGGPVGEGVIIKDGKYECQFCHKVFLERRSYNGHVGIHVRKVGKNTTDLAVPVNLEKNSEIPLPEEMPSRSKMDALIEIAQNSVFATSTVDAGEQDTTSRSASVLNSNEKQGASNGNEEFFSSDYVEIKKEDSATDRAPGEHVDHSSEEVTTVNDDEVGNACTWNANVKMDASCLNDSEPAGTSDIGTYERCSLDLGYENRCFKPNNDLPEDTPGLTVDENVFHDGVSSVPVAQSFQFFPPFDSMNKGESEFAGADQKFESVTGFEELRFDDMEPFRYGFVNAQELPSLPDDSINLRSQSAIEDGFNSSIGFDTDEVMLDVNHLTVCVWCRTEFKLEGIDSETPSDSIGYMCPTCKTKISGHFSDGLSLDPPSL